MAAPASAADLLGTAPPLDLPAPSSPLIFEFGLNWYVRGDLGITFDNAPSVSFASISIPPPGFFGSPLPAYSGRNIHTTDFTGGAGVGYRFNNYLRFDATWDYRNGPGGSSNSTVVCPYALTGLTSQAPPNPLLGYLYNTTNTCVGSASITSTTIRFWATHMSISGLTTASRPTSAAGSVSTSTPCREPSTSTRPPTVSLMPPI